MRLILTLICFSICSHNCFSEIDLIERSFINYRIKLEKPKIHTSGTDELFISVFKNDLPVTKLLLRYEGVLEEFLVRDITKNESPDIVLLLKHPSKNVRVLSLQGFELVELTVKNQDLASKNVNFLKIEKKGDDVQRTLEVSDDARTYQLVQKFCFKKMGWCDQIN